MKLANEQQVWSFLRGMLKAGGAALVANGVNQSSIQQWVTGAVMAIIGFVFSHAHHADDPTTQPVVQKPPTAVPLLLSFALSWALAFPAGVGLSVLTGCGTNAPTKAAQAEQILITTVNDGMTEWAAYVNAGKAKQSQIDRVHTAYDSYYSAQLVAKAAIEKAIAAQSGTSTNDLATANAAVKSAEASLLSLLNQYIIK